MTFSMGNHIGLIGEIGAGKTTIAESIIGRIVSEFSCKKLIFYCKPDEKKRWGRDGVLFSSAEDLVSKLSILKSAKSKYQNRIIFIDDILSMLDMERGKVPEPLRFLILTGRSSKCTIMLGVHYIRRIPPLIRNETAHYLLFKPSLLAEDGVARLFGDRVLILATTLRKHETLYVNNFDGSMKPIPPIKVGECENVKKFDLF